MMSGTITLNPPPILDDFTPADNFISFFGIDNPNLISPEFNFLGRFQGFQLDQNVDVTYREILQGMRDSRLFNPFYLLSILNGECNQIQRFCTENFKIWLTFLYRNRGLPPLVRPMTVKEILNGTESPFLEGVQKQDPRFGGDPTVRTKFNVLPHDGVPEDTLEMQMFSGSQEPDRARNVLRFDQNEQYITTEKTFYHENRNSALTEVRTERVNPWLHEVYTAAGTDGFQFNPDMTNRDDLVFYVDYFKAMISIDFQTVMNIYGLKGFIFETPTKLYEKRTEDNGISGITIGDHNPYHNFHFNDVFNVSAVYGVSYFVSEPMFSRASGNNEREIQSEIINQNEESITGSTHWNDQIICEPWSGLVIRGETGFQMNFFYDSYTPHAYQQFLMPYILYNKRLDIDGAMARDLFNEITLNDERMRLVFILSLIIGGLLTS